MSDDQQKGQDVSQAVGSEDNMASNAEQGANLSRRKFTKTGVIAAPVIMTLISRPVFGGGSGGWTKSGSKGDSKGGGYKKGGKCTLSGMLSGNLSQPTDKNCVCKPDYSRKHCKTHPEHDKWKKDCSPGKITWVCDDEDYFGKKKVCWGGKDDNGRDATKCGEKFPDCDSRYKDESLMTVLWKADYDKECGLLAQAITAYCNASDLDYGFSSGEVQAKCSQAWQGTYTNYFMKEDSSLGCEEALKMEFEFFNECDPADYSLDYEIDWHWDKEAYKECQEYRTCKDDDWEEWVGRECQSLDEYRKWKYQNYDNQSSFTSYDYSDGYNRYCENYSRTRFSSFRR